MITTTTETVPGKEIAEALGIARGSTVRARNVGRDIFAGLKNLVGGEIDEYTKLQAEAAEAAKVQAQFGEQRELIEQKYSRQAEEAAREAAAAKSALQDYKKTYALEKVFYSAGGRTDAADGVSFFDMMAQQIGGNFRQEADGSLTVIDAGGDPVLDKESGKRISVEDYILAYKAHPIYGTFFKGSKGAGAGIGYGGTDANGVVSQDFSPLTPDKIFQQASK